MTTSSAGPWLTDREREQMIGVLTSKKGLSQEYAGATVEVWAAMFDKTHPDHAKSETLELRKRISAQVQQNQNDEWNREIEKLNIEHKFSTTPSFQKFLGRQDITNGAIIAFIEQQAKRHENLSAVPDDEKQLVQNAKAANDKLGTLKQRLSTNQQEMAKKELKAILGVASEEQEFDPNEMQETAKDALGKAMQGGFSSLFSGNLPDLGGMLQGILISIIKSMKSVKDYSKMALGWAMSKFSGGEDTSWQRSRDTVKGGDVNQGLLAALDIDDKKGHFGKLLENLVDKKRKEMRQFDNNRPSNSSDTPAPLLQFRTSVPQHEGTEPVSVPIDVPVSPLETPPGNPALQRIVNPAVAHS